MRTTYRGFQFTAFFMTALMLVIAGPYQAAVAALIPTENAVDSTAGPKVRDKIKNFLSRQDAQEHLIAKGISPDEAKARVDSLADAEALMLSNQIDHMPVGGSAVGIIVGAILIVFIILLITDLTGLTDVFPFVKKHK